jgi:predicted GNAT superfamily acetyltransferase
MHRQAPATVLLRRVETGGRSFWLKVETSSQAEDYAKYEELRNEIWGYPQDNLPSTRNMMCENYVHEGSSLFIAAYAQDERGRLVEDKEHLVGFSYGFVGLRDKSIAFKALDNLWFYSQYTGVKESFRSFGLGLRIKEFQADILREVLGVFNVTCTYDPLTGVNAYRNIHHLGMQVMDYRAAIYGEYGGHLNRPDIPSDRFFVLWDLKAQGRRPAYADDVLSRPEHYVLNASRQTVRGRSGLVEMEVVQNAGLAGVGRAGILLVPIPEDFYRMLKETDVEEESVRRIPLEWRLRTREVFGALLDEGYRVVDFRKAGHGPSSNVYVLQKAG